MKFFNARDWHTWLSVILSIPLLIVGITAVLLAHEKSLGLKEMPISVGWLSGYGMEEEHGYEDNLRTTGYLPNGDLYVASKAGLFIKSGDAFIRAVGTPQAEFRQVIEANGQVFAAGKMGLYKLTQDNWTSSLDGEMWGISYGQDKLMAIVKDKGQFVSTDMGETWQADDSLKLALKDMGEDITKEPMTLSKLVIDLHTGKAFLGKEGEWVWIDILGGIMVFLTLTGLFMWWVSQRRKRELS